MASVNEAFLIGHLGKDPEVRFTESGQAVCNFTLATNETWNDKDGKKNEKTEWHRIVVWGKAAESCGEYLEKGRQVCVRGRIQTREWKDKEGVTKYTTEIVANPAGGVTFLGSGKGEKNGNSSSEGDTSFP